MNRQKQRAFSLIEILVVLVIIAFATKLVVYNLGDDEEDALAQSALKVETALDLASDWAVLHQRELGLYVEGRKYEFLVFEENKWIPLKAGKALEPVELPETLRMQLNLEDLPWARDNLLSLVNWQALIGSDDDSLLELEKMKIPHILLLSSGEVSPFELRIELADEPDVAFVIRGKYMAPVEMEREEGL